MKLEGWKMVVELMPLPGFPLVQDGDDIARLIIETAEKSNASLKTKDILVIAHTIVSKSEGMIFCLEDIHPSEFAKKLADLTGKDPRHVELILKGAKSIVRVGRGLIITETIHGFVCANSGVDKSNVSGASCYVTLPEDPDRSARDIRKTILEVLGLEDLAIVISDTFGRPLRSGVVNVAVGASGLRPIVSLIGKTDLFGYEMRVTEMAVADEIAAASELVMGQTDEGLPVIIIRGYDYVPAEVPATVLNRPLQQDLFR
jgi:coenzyme F420-0:L-glutamate ligase/coenzyme F420-1:gamma-L-glutamate ligase